MAVVTVQQSSTERGSEKTPSGRTYHRTYIVQCDDVTTSEYEVRNAPEIPLLHTSHPDDPSAFCTRLQTRPAPGQAWIWHVEATWETPRGQFRDPSEPNPMLRGWSIAWDSYVEQIAVEKDRNGLPIVNTAGDPFDPPLLQDKVFPVLRITRNEYDFYPSYMYQFANAVNSDPFYGALPGYAKMSAPRAQRRYEDPYTFWEITYEIIFNPDSWTREVVNVGFTEIVTPDEGDNYRAPILDEQGNQFNVAQPLGMDGKKLPLGAVPLFLSFDTYHEKPFSALQLDEPEPPPGREAFP